jgi:excinuclease ABC subunit A
MRAADYIIDIGPDAGAHGGELIFNGTIAELPKSDSYTARYLNGLESSDIPEKRRKPKGFFRISGATENNLKNIDVDFPLGVLSVITGVSGSGKSTLLKKILYPAIGKLLGTVGDESGKYLRLEGDYNEITAIEFIDQNPIGKSSRSNPVTYLKAYDPIRQLYADLPEAKRKALKPAHFSFNVDGGRCETCQGEGVVKIEMQFMADIYLKCETCKGKRFKDEVLEVTYNGKNISDVLELTVDESMEFFEAEKQIIRKLKPLKDVGLGYITLGQSSNSLSGGEAQRVKLAYFLSKGNDLSKQHTLFIFDEPTTGLHFHDIKNLMTSVQELINQGNTAIIIEHNTEVIKLADYIIDLGPEGGEQGGHVVFAGTPEDLVKSQNGYTSHFLKNKV